MVVEEEYMMPTGWRRAPSAWRPDRAQPAAAQEGQEHQAGEDDAGQHGRAGIHLAGEVDPDQAEGEDQSRVTPIK